jgi:hypothetical protein
MCPDCPFVCNNLAPESIQDHYNSQHLMIPQLALPDQERIEG